MEQRIEIQAPGSVVLSGIVHLPERGSSVGAVICHGMMSYKDSPKHRGLAEELTSRGFAVLRFDFSGRGESGGDLMGLTFTRQVAECRAAIERLRTYQIEKIALVGSSMGGAVAILVAALGEVDGLATMASIGRAELLPERAVGERGVALWKRKGFIRIQKKAVGYALVEDSLKIDIPAQAAKISCPWLLLHGMDDEVIPVSDAQVLFEASNKKAQLEIVPGADHRFSKNEHRKEIIKKIADFLEHNVVPSQNQTMRNT